MSTAVIQHKCAKSEYLELFTNSDEPLDWLCFTLTGDRELSERVLEAALEQTLKGAEPVFRDWMLSWARRLIIKACADIVKPWTSAIVEQFQPMFSMRAKALDDDRVEALVNVPSGILQTWLLRMEPLGRFVFVLRVIEGYTRRDTSLLLNIDDKVCEWAYVRAVETIESFCGSGKCLAAVLRNQSDCCLA